MESSGLEFYERVRNGYLDLAKKESRYRLLDALQTVDDIHDAIWEILAPSIEKHIEIENEKKI
jgi:dTMP kinase